MNADNASLYLGLATAIATSLGAAISLGVLKPDRSRLVARAWATAVLCAAVLGLGAALIAVGKGHSTPMLTRLMFAGLLLPGLTALHRILERLLLRRRSVNAALMGLTTAVLTLVLLSSPTFLREVFDPHDVAAERREAEQRAGFFRPAPWYECLVPSNCPGPRYVAFNVYRNNPVVGDERYFTSAAHALPSGDERSDLVTNAIRVKPGDEIVVRVFFNNGADFPPTAGRTTDPRATARNSRVAIVVPTDGAGGLIVTGILYADNARPRLVRDSVAITADEVIHLEPVEGSGTLNNKFFENGLRIPDDVFMTPSERRDQKSSSAGTPIGYDRLDGNVGGSFGQAGYVTARLRVS